MKTLCILEVLFVIYVCFIRLKTLFHVDLFHKLLCFSNNNEYFLSLYVEKIEGHIYVFIKTLIKNHKNFSSKMEQLFSFPVLFPIEFLLPLKSLKVMLE